MSASEGLIAELDAVRSDGTPRGLQWQIITDAILAAAPHATTDEEIKATNAAIAIALSTADDAALGQLEYQMALAQLRSVMDEHR